MADFPVIRHMFTGIIEAVGRVAEVRANGSNRDFFIESPVSAALRPDQSISHNGVCLTVTAVGTGGHWVTAIRETLERSDAGRWKAGTVLNLERCMAADGRFDGHIVQGHVDQTGVVKSVLEQNGSWLLDIGYDPAMGNFTVEKGSICVSGVSLTCFNTRNDAFNVAIIPYTWEHTNLSRLTPGDIVNLEFDIVGKYIRRLLELSRQADSWKR